MAPPEHFRTMGGVTCPQTFIQRRVEFRRSIRSSARVEQQTHVEFDKVHPDYAKGIAEAVSVAGCPKRCGCWLLIQELSPTIISCQALFRKENNL
jgi:hypothetical protein